MSRSQHASHEHSQISYYNRLFFTFFVTAAVLAVILTGSLTYAYSRVLVRSSESHNEQLLSQTNYTLDSLAQDENRLQDYLLSDPYITACLEMNSTESTTMVLAMRSMNRQIMVLPYIQSIHLYNSRLDLVLSSDTGYQLSYTDHPDQEFFSRLSDPDFVSSYHGQPVAEQAGSSGRSTRLCYYIFDKNTISEEGVPSAILILVDLSYLTDSVSAMRDLTTSSSSFVILDENKEYVTDVLNLEESESGSFRNAVKQHLSSGSIPEHSSFVSLDGTRYLQTLTRHNQEGWYLLCYTPVSQVFHSLLSVSLAALVMIIAALAITYFVCRRNARKLMSPIESLTHLIRTHGACEAGTVSRQDPKEFQEIRQALEKLRDSNEKLQSLQNESRYSLRQSTLNELVSNHPTMSVEDLENRLPNLGLSWLTSGKLCLSILKIDHYQKVLSRQAGENMWALRFGVVTIIQDLASGLTSTCVSRDDDKFLLIVQCPPGTDPDGFARQLEGLFHAISQKTQTEYGFTMTAAYSTLFQGIDKLPAVYHNTRASLHLTLRYGSNVILDPYRMEEVREDPIHFPFRLTTQLLDALSVPDEKAAAGIYGELSQDLPLYEYHSVITALSHMIYSLYERLSERFPMLTDYLSEQTKKLFPLLDAAETKEELDEYMNEYFTNICSRIRQTKDRLGHDSSSAIVSRMVSLINERYSDPSLCLNSIAGCVGLSSNYAGHLFKNAMKKSVSQYLLDIRLEKFAEYYKKTDLSVDAILEKIGLEKNNYFYTRFKNYFGMSLGEYKLRYRADA